MVRFWYNGEKRTEKGNEIMNFYAISVRGWEEYSPLWFSSEKSSRSFRIATRLAIRKIFKDLMKEKYDHYMDGHIFLERIPIEMEKLGFNQVKIECEIDLQGSCLYRKNKHEKRPSIFPPDIWKGILKHNDEIRDDSSRRFRSLRRLKKI